MKVYNKLVRDKIPQIIEANGQKAQLKILEDDAYLASLEEKLNEEVGEYHRDKNLEELADILEVVYALADEIGSREELMAIFDKKHQARGGFEKRYYLVSTSDVEE